MTEKDQTIAIKYLKQKGYPLDEAEKIIKVVKNNFARPGCLAVALAVKEEYFSNKEIKRTEEEIQHIITKCPTVLTMRDDDLTQRESLLLEKGFTKEQFKQVEDMHPAIYTKTQKEREEQIDAHNELGLGKKLLTYHQSWIIRPKLLIARHSFLTCDPEDPEITYENSDDLFLPSDEFEYRFDISKAELLGETIIIKPGKQKQNKKIRKQRT